MKLTNGIDRAQFHDKAWALWHEKALASALLPKLSIHAIRTLWDVLYDSMPQPQAAEPKGMTYAQYEALLAFAARIEEADEKPISISKDAAKLLRALLANGE